MKEKKSHGVQLLLRAVVKDPDGKILSDTGQKPSKSFVIQFLEFIHLMFIAPEGYSSITATDGSEDPAYRDVGHPAWFLLVDAPTNISYYGLVIGRGDTAKTNTDYKLAIQLNEGVGANQMTHGTTIVGYTGVVGANVDLEITRSFTNNSGSSITVKEAGIYYAYIWGDPPETYSNKFCMIRDVLVAPINVPDKCSLTVYYTFRTTV